MYTLDLALGKKERGKKKSAYDVVSRLLLLNAQTHLELGLDDHVLFFLAIFSAPPHLALLGLDVEAVVGILHLEHFGRVVELDARLGLAARLQARLDRTRRRHADHVDVVKRALLRLLLLLLVTRRCCHRRCRRRRRLGRLDAQLAQVVVQRIGAGRVAHKSAASASHEIVPFAFPLL